MSGQNQYIYISFLCLYCKYAFAVMQIHMSTRSMIKAWPTSLSLKWWS